MTHAEGWGIIAEPRRGMKIKWIKVESHTNAKDYLIEGNREVDALAQTRTYRLHVLKLALPDSWKYSKELIIVLEGERMNLLKTMHVFYMSHSHFKNQVCNQAPRGVWNTTDLVCALETQNKWGSRKGSQDN